MKTRPDQRPTETRLLTTALDALAQTTGLHAEVITPEPVLPHAPNRRPDALIALDVEGKRHKFVVETKTADRFAALAAIKVQLEENRHKGVLIAPYIAPELAEECRAIDLNFIDTAGNAYLRARGLYVFVTGRRRETNDFPITPARTGTATGLRVTFALLCKPALLNAPYREINEAAGVALGAVGWVFFDLTHRGYLVGDRRKGGRRFVDVKRLLNEWVTTYPLKLRPKLGGRTFRGPHPHWWQEFQPDRYGAYWGGEVAAEKLTGYLKPERATLYVRGDPGDLIIDQRLRPDPGGDVELLETFWNLEAEPDHRTIVPPILAYADLMGTLDTRNHEAAKQIYERHIVPALDAT